MTSQNILIRMPNWVGDVVMATPVLVDLRKAFPNAQITAMCQSPVSQLLEKDPAIDELFSFSKQVGSFERREQHRDLLLKIREGKYDTGILLTNSFSSAWFFWRAAVKKRIGFRGDFRSWLLTDAVEKPGKEHQIVKYKRLLKPLGMEVSQTMPRLVVTEEEKSEALQLLVQRGYERGRPLVGMNPGAAFGTAKCWPPERFKELAKKLIERGIQVVFFGDGASRDWIQKICPVGAMNLAGATDLRELVCLIGMCSQFVTNDSGPMHIASAVGTPLIALFGSTDEEVTGPYGNRQVVINKKVACAPCLKRTCPIDFRCMRSISVAEVLERIDVV